MLNYHEVMTTDLSLLTTAAGKWEAMPAELEKAATRYGDTAPALIQRLAFQAVAGGVRRALVQSQVYLSMADVAEPRRRAVVRLVLTATAGQHDEVLGDFQDFVSSVRPGTGNEA
ncbi:hypothetical protein BX286_1142 [Streptomyces sp. 3211.6]|uniref:hypothetical protein n=1 Tax=Streptomyces TaxID=1883 RepID=UPI0009A54990|nr:MULTISPECIES: hypothetical protein [Streptomyces]RKT03218.1 hypothetical protein BX286_1142 [Streptomyces sp. 3211.6]RPF29361.1 hypothetical protein EDD96_5881 [Streptomyces sp. Ag109_G2-6]